MFLGVSGTVLAMDENDQAELAKLIREQRQYKFGTKSAAYKAADVNAATWERAEQGLSVREDRLVAIVRTLWPDSGGNYRLVMEDAQVEKEAGFIPRSAPDDLRRWMAHIQGQLSAALLRITDLELQVDDLLNKEGGGEHGDGSAPTNLRSLSPEELTRWREKRYARATDEALAARDYNDPEPPPEDWSGA